MRYAASLRRAKKFKFFSLVLLLVAAGSFWLYHPASEISSPRLGLSSKKRLAAIPSFNKSQYSINDPSSLWAVVDKGRVLPRDYVPADLVTPGVPLRLSSFSPEMKVRDNAARSMERMFGVATSQNIHLMLASGYRSYAEQAAIYSGYIKTAGQTQADVQSAMAGHSEHQSGWAADLESTNRKCELDQCFGDTPEGKWLAANAHSFGFIIRYQKGQENLTGYEYEPWHIRYVGVDLAAQIIKSRETLEQFFGLPAVIQYPPSSFQLRSGA